MDQACRGGRVLSASPVLTVLATPILGAQLSRDLIGRIESVDGVRCAQIAADGRIHGDANESAFDDAEVLLLGSVPASVLDHVVTRSSRLRWIHSAAAGVDRVTTPVVRERGLMVTNARGVFSRPIAEYVVMMSLAISRRLPQLLELQRERTWQPLRGRELSELTIGIVGYGSIGAELSRLLAPFGCRILATRRHPERGAGDEPNVELHGLDRLDEVLRASDIVVVAAPLTDETAGLIGAEQLAQMREDAWLINIARGRLIDEIALRRALQSGWIGGAVLDVFSEEPLAPDSPLYSTPNLLITPHTSWASDRVAERTVDLFVENLRAFRAGEPMRNVVDLEAGY
ncbi:MAG TPA: D-2-hydroxyacid dehydrogenase [Candidatus Limnocylindrales bacterium]|nr:D-2-hydroxyacid dehydrogenase [Candidatus Limnocylindrales bacterium]